MKKVTAFILSAVFLLTLSIRASAVSTYTAELDIGNINTSITSVYIDGKYVSKTPCKISVKLGSEVKLVSSNEDLMFYADSNNNVLSSEKEYAFTFLSAMRLNVWSGNKSDKSTYVIYRNTNDTKQILSYAVYSDVGRMTSHLLEDASKFGYDFVSWDKSIEDIKTCAANGDRMIFVEPIYTRSAETVTVKVENGTVSGASSAEVIRGSEVSLSAFAAEDGKKFAYWTDADGNIVSDRAKTTVAAVYDETYRAVFLPESEQGTLSPSVRVRAEYSEDIGRFVLYTVRFVPQGSEIGEGGILYVKDKEVKEEDMTVEKADEASLCRAVHTFEEGSSGIAINRLSCDEFAYVRPYLVAKDGSVIYGDMRKLEK